jgi:hypothetical protein
MALNSDQAIRLARALRDLRESALQDHALTQAQLAAAFSTEEPVASATVSSWESTKKPKTPPANRLGAYARFFCTRRSLEDEPHMIAEDQLTPVERERFRQLEAQLLELFNPDDGKVQSLFQFDAGPVIVICPDAPEDMRGPLANERSVNFTKMQTYADLDALIEIYGHLRAENPTLAVRHRLASEIVSDDLSSHVILLGGITWNRVTHRFQSVLSQIPIRQVAVDDLKGGDIFLVQESEGQRSFYPKYQDLGDGKEVVEDIGYLARLQNPFKVNRTLTICNGIHGRGVLGAVRCLTDDRVREENEKYLAGRFPTGDFAMLLRVPVVANETLSPDLQNPDARLYEWEANQDGGL